MRRKGGSSIPAPPTPTGVRSEAKGQSGGTSHNPPTKHFDVSSRIAPKEEWYTADEEEYKEPTLDQFKGPPAVRAQLATIVEETPVESYHPDPASRTTSKGLPPTEGIIQKRKNRQKLKINSEFSIEESDSVCRLAQDLLQQRPDLQHTGYRAGSSSDRPMDVLRSLLSYSLGATELFSYCSKSRFRTFANKLRGRLRFTSSTVLGEQRPIVEVRHSQQDRTIATWVVPPDDSAPDWEWHRYKACAQAGWEDDLDGIYLPGLKLNHEKLQSTGFFSDEVVSDVKRGHEWRLERVPKPFLGKNYASWQDYPETAEADFLALKHKRYIEGPLGYVPHVVTSLGMVVKIDSTGKLKLRTCVDATASGFNDALARVYTKLDQVTDAISKTVPECWMSKIDLSDAFLQLPIEASHCNYMGFRNLKGEFWRYRFSPFGIAAAPWLCQRFAYELKEYMNNKGLQHVAPTLSDGTPNPAASYDGFCCSASYIDDHHFVHPPWLTEGQAAEQLTSVQRSVQELGVIIKPEKVEGPVKLIEFLGVVIDSVQCTVGISEGKNEKLQALIQEFLDNHSAGSAIGRKSFAALIGKLQFYAPYLRGAQGCLADCYKSRDDFEDDATKNKSVKARWGKDVKVVISSAALSSLQKILLLLETEKGKRYYHFEGKGLYWGDVSLASDDILDKQGNTSCGAYVLTTDAAGHGGGYWGKDCRVQFRIPPASCAPHKSSNYRELYTIVRAVREQGPKMVGGRLLVRTDNAVGMYIIRKQASNDLELNELMSELSDLCREHELDLQVRHIIGKANHMADRLSRYLQLDYDTRDWQFIRSEFEAIQAELGQDFDIDACADPAGFNSQLAWFWSSRESCLEKSWQGKNVWCNPPFSRIKEILQHFLHQWSLSPGDTSATFVVPAWTWASWYHLRKHFKIIRSYPTGSHLFTTPNWEAIHAGGVSSSGRIDRGATSWPVLVLHKATSNPQL